MNTQSMIIVIILLIVLIPAVKSTITHLKGEGSCCGGPKEKVPKKVIKGTKLAELELHVEGMHCNNCKNSIERHLNELDGVIANVNLKKKICKVTLYKDVSKEQIIRVIENLDFKVIE